MDWEKTHIVTSPATHVLFSCPDTTTNQANQKEKRCQNQNKNLANANTAAQCMAQAVIKKQTATKKIAANKPDSPDHHWGILQKK